MIDDHIVDGPESSQLVGHLTSCLFGFIRPKLVFKWISSQKPIIMGVAVRLEHSHGQSRVVWFLLFLFLMVVSGYDIGGARIVRRHLRILTGEARRTDRGLLGLGSQVWRECYFLRRMAERR
jgi:hypothetical protein